MAKKPEYIPSAHLRLGPMALTIVESSETNIWHCEGGDPCEPSNGTAKQACISIPKRSLGSTRSGNVVVEPSALQEAGGGEAPPGPVVGQEASVIEHLGALTKGGFTKSDELPARRNNRGLCHSGVSGGTTSDGLQAMISNWNSSDLSACR